jgi:hypothetical protein
MNMDAAEIIERANALKTHLLNTIQEVSYNTSRMKALDDAGRIYATPHWRDGKYLYLLHPGRDQEETGPGVHRRQRSASQGQLAGGRECAAVR